MNDAPAQTFQPRLGLFDATMLVAGSMIGSGIFIVSADIARDVGSTGWLLAIWLLTGIMTIMGALSYAELAAMMPHAGGQYVYLREAYGPLWGFLYGWTAFLVIQTGFIAAVSVAFAKFLGVLIPDFGTDHGLWTWDTHLLLKLPVPWLDEQVTFFERKGFTISAGQLVAVGVVVLLTSVNLLGVHAGKWVQNIFTVAKMLGLAMLIVLGLTIAFNAETMQANFSNLWGGIATTDAFYKAAKIVPFGGMAALMVAGAAMVGSLFSADAWNNITYTAGEIRNPKRTLPWSLVLGTTIVIGLYLLANLAYVAALPIQGDKAAALDKEAAVLDEQVKVADNSAHMLHLQAETKRADAAVLRLRALIGVPEVSGFWHPRPNLAKWKEELGNHEQVIEMAKVGIARRRARIEESRKNVRQLTAEAAFLRGIAGAKDDRVGTAVLERASPTIGVTLMALAIMISTFGCVNGLVLMGPRLYYAMAKDGLFFQSVGHLNRNRVPAVGLVLQGIWSILLIFSGTYSELLDYIIFAALLFYVLTVAGLFVLRRKQPNAERPYRALGYPVVPLLYIGLCAFIMCDLLIVKPVYSWPSFIIVLAGIPVFWLWCRRV